jgi:hypothetical protein
VGGVYWFLDDEGGNPPIEGEIVAYNFSKTAVRGTIEIKVCEGVRMATTDGHGGFPRQVEIPPFDRVRIPLALAANIRRYLNGEIEVTFRRDDRDVPTNLVFGLETRPGDALLSRELPIAGRRPEGSFEWIWAPEPYRITSRVGPWLGVNGIEIAGEEGSPPTGELGTGWRFRQTERQTDPRLTPMAITRIAGLPEVANGFLRLRIPEAAARMMDIRVDLVDAQGQRFSVSENYGRNWIDPVYGETFLSYRDFHLYVWGHCTVHPVFRPADIREIQLRFYSKSPAGSAEVRLDVVAPARSDNP